jgi:3-oxosteroid 1-dehydrogenase
MGAAVQGRMLKLCLSAGIPIWPETPVEDFIVENGRVVGVVANRKGASVRIQATNGVLINAGGFSRNQAMRDRYMRQPTSAEWTSVCAGDTGEMQQAAMRLGAAVDQMEQAWWHTSSMHRDGSFPSSLRGSDGKLLPYFQSYDIAKPHGIVVDQSGQRYFNESVSYGEQVERMYQRNATMPATPSWQIMDSRHRNQYFWGLEPPGRTPHEWLESGYLKKADTLDELAQLCSMDQAQLKATVERFNDFARKGVDEDFHRGENEYSKFMGDPTYANPGLGTIEKPPFYACAMFPTDLGTCGGLVCDDHARVLREDGSIIDGLYATGNSAATVMGRTIPAAGVCVGSSFLWGWVAACHACGRPD